MKMTVNDRIKQRRKELGLDADYIAQQLGISRATYYRYESKEIEKIPISALVPLAKVLHTTPQYLMGWDEEMEEYKAGKTDEELEKTSAGILSYIYDSLSEKGQEKFLDYLNDLQNNPENVDPDTFVRDIFLDNLNDEALRKRKALAKELRTQNKLEKSLIKKEMNRRKNAPVKE